MTKFDVLKWVPCDSRSDMEARTSGEKIIGTLLTSDANTWGYIHTPGGWHLNIGYANIGLVPQSMLIGQRMFVGINECLVGYDLSIGAAYFFYRMPLVFHEFIEISDSLIVRDEMGFIGIAPDGRELWKFCTEGVVESYAITSSKISGSTTEGSSFSFEIPVTGPYAYVTTRVLLPTQDLSTDVLKFALIPGVIRHLKFANNATRGTWKTAFPTRDGDVLQLRDLEQGLEQMKRVSNQDVTMQIVPGDVPGESDVVIAVKRTKPWSFVVSADNSGVSQTGRYIGSATLGLNNLLGLNDILTLGYNQDLAFRSGMGTQGWNASYSMPWGYWTGTLFGYTNQYSQQIAGINQTFTASGNTQTAGMKVERVLHRGQDDVSGMELQFIKRFGASFINDTEIPQQYRDNTYVEAGLTNRHYFGASQFDGTLAYRQGIGGFGAMPDTQSGPTYRFHMATLDGNLSVPFSIGKQPLRYVGTVHGQYTNDELNYLDDLTLGSRYTVRGFSGETMLAAEKGFYWRNELQMPLGQSGQTLYAGLDYGQVWGPSAAYLAGTQLAGAVVGLRGRMQASLGALSYDLFVGTPVYKPASFIASKVVAGFQVTAQF